MDYDESDWLDVHEDCPCYIVRLLRYHMSGCDDEIIIQVSGVVSTPEFSPPPGSYVLSRYLTISCAMGGERIHKIVVPKG